MKKDKIIHVRCCDELKEYCQEFGSDAKAIYAMFYAHRDLNRALNDGGLRSLKPEDLVGLVRCLVNDKKRLKTKRGA